MQRKTSTTFTGTYNAGTMTCSAIGQSLSEGIGSGTVVNGTTDAAGNVRFDLDTQGYRLTGKVSGMERCLPPRRPGIDRLALQCQHPNDHRRHDRLSAHHAGSRVSMRGRCTGRPPAITRS
jgi:hypothetical protein